MAGESAAGVAAQVAEAAPAATEAISAIQQEAGQAAGGITAGQEAVLETVSQGASQGVPPAEGLAAIGDLPEGPRQENNPRQSGTEGQESGTETGSARESNQGAPEAEREKPPVIPGKVAEDPKYKELRAQRTVEASQANGGRAERLNHD